MHTYFLNNIVNIVSKMKRSELHFQLSSYLPLYKEKQTKKNKNFYVVRFLHFVFFFFIRFLLNLYGKKKLLYMLFGLWCLGFCFCSSLSYRYITKFDGYLLLYLCIRFVFPLRVKGWMSTV